MSAAVNVALPQIGREFAMDAVLLNNVFLGLGVIGFVFGLLKGEWAAVKGGEF